MKKMIYAAVTAVVIGAASVRADMFDREYALSTSGTGKVSRAYVVRGELRGVAIERTGDTAILAGTNMTVTVSSPFHTAFSYAWDGNTDTFKVPLCMADNAADGSTNTNTYTSIPIAGLCTVAIAPPAGVAVTNDFKVTLIYWR